MSTSKEYNELILNLLKEQGKDISDSKEDIAQLKTAKHVVKDYKEWRGKVDDVWSPPQMKEVKDEVYVQKEQWVRTIGILIGVELVIGVVTGVIIFIFK